MALAMKPGDGTCGVCSSKLEEFTKDGSTLTLCSGCGIVCGDGDAARLIIEREVATGKAKRIDAAPGFYAMRVTGGPTA